jgi:hypothetical protein
VTQHPGPDIFAPELKLYLNVPEYFALLSVVINFNREEETMATRPRSVTLNLNTKEQSLESLGHVLARIGGLAGCTGCGRIAVLHADLLGDPEPSDQKIGINSMQIEN